MQENINCLFVFCCFCFLNEPWLYFESGNLLIDLKENNYNNITTIARVHRISRHYMRTITAMRSGLEGCQFVKYTLIAIAIA